MAETPPSPPPSASAPTTEPGVVPALRRRVPWLELGIEAFAVFLSVMAGFAVTAWVEARHEDALRRTALDQFAQELTANREQVRDVLPYHGRTHDTFDDLAEASAADRSDVDLSDAEQVLPGWEGPRQVRFAETARRAAEGTGALALLDFETAGRLSDVHTTQDELMAIQRSLIQAGFTPQMFESTNVSASLQALALYFETVFEYEQELDSLYSAALARVEAVGGRADRAWGTAAP